jgi:hypothetical protein
MRGVFKDGKTMNQADTLITIEKAEVGYREGYSDGHYDNHQKYSPAVPGLEWSQNQSWCETFQSWAFQEAGEKSLAPVTASCPAAVAWYKGKSRFSYYPAIGAQVFFGPGGGKHVGLVYAYDADNAYTIEGNTNTNGSNEGNGVYLKVRPRRDAHTYGYGLPAYPEGVVTADPGLKGKAGFTYRATASSGAAETPPVAPVEAALPWVSSGLRGRAATHSTTGEKPAPAESGCSDPADDVALVQDALERVMGVAPDDPHGVFDAGTQALYDEFRRERLGRSGADATGAPEAESLVELATRSGLFNVRAGSAPAPALPSVDMNQVVWAATHSAREQQAQPAGSSATMADVTLVQDALAKVMHTTVADPPGVFGPATQSLYDEFRRTILRFSPADATGRPGEQSLTELGARSGLFQVRVVSAPVGGPTGGPRITAKEVTFDRYAGGGTMDAWIAQGCAAAGVPSTAHWARGFKTAAARESSGNPNVCNLWDTNARTPHGFSEVRDYGDGVTRDRPIRRLAGELTPFQCSRGLVQFIPQTFALYHVPGTSPNIYDPVASIAAAIRCVREEHGVTADGANLAAKVQQFDPDRPAKGWG